MTKRKFLLISVFILAFLLRVWRIGDYPKTLYGDEQAFAWNAFNILKTGTDEYGTPYPLQFRSFNDYKAPIPVYILVPFFKFFSMNSLSLRLPVVFFSFFTVVVFFYFMRLFFNHKISLLSLFFFTVSPWHIHLSRGFFEATISLFFFIFAIYTFFNFKFKLIGAVISAILFNLSIYSYFTPRILLLFFIPLMIYVGFKFFFQSVEKRISFKYLFVFFSVLFIASLPLLYQTFFNKGLSRFDKLNESIGYSLASTVNRERSASLLPANIRELLHNKYTVRLRLIKNNYFEHFSINFWYLYGDNSLRYFLGNMGMFYLFELPLVIIGFIYLLRLNKPLAIFLLIWVFIVPIPASIVGRPFAVRSLPLLPVPFIFAGLGIYKLQNFFRFNQKLLLAVLFYLLMLGYLCHNLITYYFEYPVYAATWWGWENKIALDYAKDREEKYQHIFISDYYTGLPLAFAVYNSIDPVEFRKAINNPIFLKDNRKFINIGKYYFGSLDINKDRLQKNIIPPSSLYLGRPEEADSDITIRAPEDGRIIFKVYEKN